MAESKSKAFTFVPGKGYRELVRTIISGKREFEQALKKLTAQYYWSLGDHINKHILQNKDRADYGTYVYAELEKDTGIEDSTLYRAVQFRLAYPILVARRELTWDIYRKLITVSDKKERQNLEKMVIENSWNGDRLQGYLNTRRTIEKIKTIDGPIPQLKFERGTLYTYRIIERKTLGSPDGKFIDIGFSQWSDVKAASRFAAGDIVESSKSEEGDYSLKKTPRGAQDLYTFAATVESVVDGDTQWVIVDLGFSTWRRQKLRLRGIDCPEIDTEEGKRAKKFVEDRLRPCEFIVVKTYKDEKFGRMLADVFYRPGAGDPSLVASDGIYLNQELLDNRLVVVYKT